MPDLRQQIHAHYDAQTLPAEKAETILTRGRAAATGEEPEVPESKVVELPRSRRRWMPALALAAALAVFAGLAMWLLPQAADGVSYAQLAPTVVNFFGAGLEPSKHSQDKAALRAWLIAKGAPADFEIPKSLLPLESFGCDVLDVDGRPAYLTCFWRDKRPDGTGSQLVHLVVARRDDFRDVPDSGKPHWRELEGWSFASWSEGNVLYTLAAAAPPQVLERFVGAGLPSRHDFLAARLEQI